MLKIIIIKSSHQILEARSKLLSKSSISQYQFFQPGYRWSSYQVLTSFMIMPTSLSSIMQYQSKLHQFILIIIIQVIYVTRYKVICKFHLHIESQLSIVQGTRRPIPTFSNTHISHWNSLFSCIIVIKENHYSSNRIIIKSNLNLLS